MIRVSHSLAHSHSCTLSRSLSLALSLSLCRQKQVESRKYQDLLSETRYQLETERHNKELADIKASNAEAKIMEERDRVVETEKQLALVTDEKDALTRAAAAAALTIEHLEATLPVQVRERPAQMESDLYNNS